MLNSQKIVSRIQEHVFSLREKTELLVLYGVFMFVGGMLLNHAVSDKTYKEDMLLSSNPYYEREYELVEPASVPTELLEEAHQAYLHRTDFPEKIAAANALNDEKDELNAIEPASGTELSEISMDEDQAVIRENAEKLLLPKRKPEVEYDTDIVVPRRKPLGNQSKLGSVVDAPEKKQATSSEAEDNHGGGAVLSTHNLSAYGVTFAKGDSLVTVLSRSGLGKSTIAQISDRFGDLYDARKIRAGDKLSLYYDKPLLHEGKKDKAFKALKYIKAKNEYWVIRKSNNEYVTKEQQDDLVRVVKRAKGVIDSNLYALTSKLEVPSSVASQAVKAFSTYFDFRRDISQGTPLEIVYESFYNSNNEKIKEGNLLYASLSPRNKTKRIYRFSPTGQATDADYFDEQGRLSRRTLMRRPVASGVISSNYGMRKHPILKKWKMHKGVDYAAKTGTPIYAAGDGIIDYKGRRGGYGNYIRIRHDSTYETAYAHLHKYAKNMYQGKRVRRGDIIGYVGSTGRSTGPHLHYEILKHGKQVNPLKVKASKVVQLQGGEMRKFKQARDQIKTLISDFDQKNTTQLVADAGNIRW